MYEHSRTHAHLPSVYLPIPVTAHVKSTSSLSEFGSREKPHDTEFPRQYRYAITDIAMGPRTCSPFIGVPLVEIIIAALQSIFCFLYLITGQAILRAAHLDGYTASISSSVKVGAMGGVAMTLPAILLRVYRREGLVFALWSIAVDTLIGAMAGPIGVAILAQRLHEELLDPLHAARAGALGASIISAGLHILRKF
jgi:hypothetical protein